jgi:hypothetical protein
MRVTDSELKWPKLNIQKKPCTYICTYLFVKDVLVELYISLPLLTKCVVSQEFLEKVDTLYIR